MNKKNAAGGGHGRATFLTPGMTDSDFLFALQEFLTVPKIALYANEAARLAGIAIRLRPRGGWLTDKISCTTKGCSHVFKPMHVRAGSEAFSKCPECGAFVLVGQGSSCQGILDS